MKLRRFLAESPLTQAALASRAGLDQSTVSRIAAGKKNASLAVALKIEQASGGLVRAEELPISQATRKALRLVRRAAA